MSERAPDDVTPGPVAWGSVHVDDGLNSKYNIIFSISFAILTNEVIIIISRIYLIILLALILQYDEFADFNSCAEL